MTFMINDLVICIDASGTQLFAGHSYRVHRVRRWEPINYEAVQLVNYSYLGFIPSHRFELGSRTVTESAQEFILLKLKNGGNVIFKQRVGPLILTENGAWHHESEFEDLSAFDDDLCIEEEEDEYIPQVGHWVYQPGWVRSFLVTRTVGSRVFLGYEGHDIPYDSKSYLFKWIRDLSKESVPAPAPETPQFSKYNPSIGSRLDRELTYTSRNNAKAYFKDGHWWVQSAPQRLGEHFLQTNANWTAEERGAKTRHLDVDGEPIHIGDTIEVVESFLGNAPVGTRAKVIGISQPLHFIGVDWSDSNVNQMNGGYFPENFRVVK